MSTANDVIAMRRAVFRDALRRGDPLATARAASRLRAHITDLNAQEVAQLRASHQTLGRAIRGARSRRLSSATAMLAPAPVRMRGRRAVPFALAASFVLLAAALTGLLSEPLQLQTNDGGGGGGAPPPAASEAPAVVPILPQSRGRVVLAVAVAQPQPTVAPEVVAPSPSASAAPTSGASAPTGSGGPVGTGGPGGSGGPGGGTGSPAPGSPTPRPTPRPTVASCFTFVPRGSARLCGQVLDASTNRGLAGACVSIGGGLCTTTDASGRWSFQLPVGDGTLTWFIQFSKPGYGQTVVTITSSLRQLTVPAQRLTPAN